MTKQSAVELEMALFRAIEVALPPALISQAGLVTECLTAAASVDEKARLLALGNDALFPDVDACFGDAIDTGHDAERSAARRLAEVLRSSLRSPLIALVTRHAAQELYENGHLHAGLVWLRHARRLFCDDAVRGDTFANYQVLYSLMLRQEAMYLAEAGDLLGAVDKRFKSHALNHGDPEFFHVQTWTSQPPFNLGVWHMTVPPGPELRTAIMQACDINIEYAEPATTILYSSLKPAMEIRSAATLGDMPSFETSVVPAMTAHVYSVKNVRCYTDYWKSAIMNEKGHLQKDLCSGPAELVCLAQRIGFPPNYRRIEGRVAFVAANHGFFEFHHFLVEIAPRIAMLHLSGVRYDAIVAHGAVSRSFAREFFDLLGVAEDRIIGGDEPIALEVDELIVPQRTYFPSIAELTFLRALYLGEARSTTTTRTRRIFISRQKSKDRRITNIAEVVPILETFGFEMIFLEDLSGRDQARTLNDCALIVAPHGAGLANILFCEAGTRIVELIPDQCPYVFHQLSEICYLRYLAVEATWRDRDIYVCPALLAEAISRSLLDFAT